MKFEYKTIRFSRRRFFSNSIDTEELDRKLNTRGLAGWEVVGITGSTNWIGATTEVIAVLKRPMASPD